MAMQPDPEHLTKLSDFVTRAGKQGFMHSPEQMWARCISSLPCLALHGHVSSKPLLRQAHQPGAVSHTFRSICTWARFYTLGKA